MPPPESLKAVIFDLDGTLVDTAAEFVVVLQALRAEHGLDPMDPVRIRASVSNGARSLVSLGLDLPADFMRQDFAVNHTGFVRLNYYPTKDPLAELSIEHQATADLGIQHHTDAGALTVLLQDDVGGLQVYRDGYWYDIPTIEGAIVINTGDMMQVWSNDTYNAPIHRVRAMESRERYSIPFFFNPAASCMVKPLPSVINAQNPSCYHGIEWGSFRGQRSDGDFAE